MDTIAPVAANSAPSPLIDRGPPLDAETEAELKAACASIAEGLKPKRDRQGERDRRKLDTTKPTKHHPQPQQDPLKGCEASVAPAAADGYSHPAPKTEKVIHRVHRDVNSNPSSQKPRKIIKDRFPELEGSYAEVPVTYVTHHEKEGEEREPQSRHISDVPSVSPHVDYHQFIRNIGPQSRTNNPVLEATSTLNECKVRKSFESAGSASSIISPPVPPPVVEEISAPPRKKSNKPRLYLEQVLVPEPPIAAPSFTSDDQHRRQTIEYPPSVEQRPTEMAMRNFDPTFEEVRQERRSIVRPMSAQSVRPKREVPHSRSSSAVGWHEPTLNNTATNRAFGSMYLGSTNDRSNSTNNRSNSPLQKPRPKPVGKVDLNRALPPLPKSAQWENDAHYPRRSNQRTHIASLIQPEYRERTVANIQPTDGHLYWQIMSRIEEIKRAPVDAPPAPKEVIPEARPVRRPFSALGYHASLREIEYGKRSNGRIIKGAEQLRKPEKQQQPSRQPIRTGLPKALDPAVPLFDAETMVADGDKILGITRSSSLRAKTPSQRSNNRSDKAAIQKSSALDKRHIHKSSTSNINKSNYHQNRTNGHGDRYVYKPPTEHQYHSPTNVTVRADHDMTELNNFLKPKVLAELGYTRRINVENPVTWSTDGSYNGSSSYGNNSSSSGGGGCKISSSSNTNIIYNNNNNINSQNDENRRHHAQQQQQQEEEGHHIAAVKRILEHVALGRMKAGAKHKTKAGSKKSRARAEQERNLTWMDRIESQGVKGGVMILDDVANAPVVRF